MRIVSVRLEGGLELAAHCALADSWLARLRGLLGRGGLAAGEGLLLRPCDAIHMVGMRIAIDVLFLDDQGTVLLGRSELKPGFSFARSAGARQVLELPVGTIARTGVRVGDRVVIG